MRLIKIADFADRYFDESCKPDLRVVRLWCEKGLLPARRIGTIWRKSARSAHKNGTAGTTAPSTLSTLRRHCGSARAVALE